MIAITLGVVVVIQWTLIYGMLRHIRRTPKTINMTEVAKLAAEVSASSGVGYTEALRSLVGVLNYGGRFTK